MFRLIRDPQHFDLIRNEVAELSEEIDYDTWRSMHATTAVFEEGLRLHPSVPKNAWECVVEGDVMPNGGPRIEKGDLIKPDEWKYHVFNGGRRLCLGMNLALFEG